MLGHTWHVEGRSEKKKPSQKSYRQISSTAAHGLQMAPEAFEMIR